MQLSLLRPIVMSAGALALTVSAAAGASAKTSIVSPAAAYDNVAPLSAVNYSVANSVFGLQGVVVESLGGVGVAGYGVSQTLREFGVYGSVSGPLGDAIYGISQYQEATTGPTSANETLGVYGGAYNGYGVEGATAVQNGPQSVPGLYAGVIGVDLSSNSGYNDGVLGVTTNGFFGVSGFGGTGSVGGVFGSADDGSYGVFGESGQVGVEGASGTTPLAAAGADGTVVWSVDGSGNVTDTGTVAAIAPARNGQSARAYVPTSTTPLLEDVGTAKLERGVGVVKLDKAFGASISNDVYQVFLTPDGDSRGLYVSGKTASQFTVRESAGGRSTLAFDYRIVAKPYADSGRRLTLAHSKLELETPAVRLATSLKARTLLSIAAHRTLQTHVVVHARNQRKPATRGL